MPRPKNGKTKKDQTKDHNDSNYDGQQKVSIDSNRYQWINSSCSKPTRRGNGLDHAHDLEVNANPNSTDRNNDQATNAETITIEPDTYSHHNGINKNEARTETVTGSNEPAIITYLKQQFSQDAFRLSHDSVYIIEHQINDKTESYELDTNDSGNTPINKTIADKEPDYDSIAQGALDLAMACQQHHNQSNGKLDLKISYQQNKERMPIELAKALHKLAHDDRYKDHITITTNDSRLQALLNGQKLDDDQELTDEKTKKANPKNGSATSSPTPTTT
jgi:hypothetical protein